MMLKRSFLPSFYLRLAVLLLMSPALPSCVSQLRFNRVSAEVSGLRNERDDALKRSESARLETMRLEREVKLLNEENSRLKQDSTSSGIMYRKNKQLLNDLFDKYERLDKSYNALLANSSSERNLTEKDVERKEAEIVRQDKEMDELEAELTTVRAELAQKVRELEQQKKEADRLSQAVGAKEDRIREMQAQLEAKDKMLTDFKSRMTAALLSLGNASLQVSQKDGKVYVILPSATLFATGSYALQPEGKNAIQRVAQVLMQNPELEVSVEGHTDVTPYRPKAPAKPAKGKKGAPKPAPAAPVKDNWDLSSLRAATVARELYLQGIGGNRISATGKGEFYPLDMAFSEEARMRNRRIEIVIAPRLSTLYDMLNASPPKK
jgi:chemotaxis protein MotB